MVYRHTADYARGLAGHFTGLWLCCLLFMFASPAFSIDSLYTLEPSQIVATQSAADLNHSASPVATIRVDSKTIADMKAGDVMHVPLPGNKIASGHLISTTGLNEPAGGRAAPRSSTRKVVSLDNNAGSVELNTVNNLISEILIHDVISEKIYHAIIDASGEGQLQIQDNNDHYCVKYPDGPALQTQILQSPQIAAAIPDISTLRNLQSQPGSANVLYIDYWGGSLTGSVWNANHNNNNPINYTAFDKDNNPGSFSSSERYSMWLAWREAVEDFAPFNINVTTNRSVYDAAAITNRSHMIVTKTSSWYGNAGGVAYVNIFKDNSDYYKVGWTWNLSDSSMGMTISHEAGHQLGLRHDGINGLSYYSGHGVWGPIMGAPFGQRYVQWSKGEYPGANKNEDDIAIISSQLGVVADEAGNGYADATPVNLPVNNRKALTGFGDIDTYSFNLNSSGSANIKVITLLGDEDESRAGNLSMNVSLVKLNNSGGVISTISTARASDHSPLSPLTNVFEYTGTLGAGRYGLRIQPSSPDTNWATGFGSYGIAGEYRFTINATQQQAPDLVVEDASVNNNSLAQGQSFTLSVTARNQGNIAADNTTVRYYRSTNSTIDRSDTELTTDAVAALAPNGSTSENAAVTAPGTAGTYWVGACIDNVTGESNTQNNCSDAVQITVNPPARPDLIIDQLSLNRLSVTPGQSLTISATVKNQGNAGADNSTLRYYQSNNPVIDFSDTELTTDPVSNLAVNGSQSRNATVAAPGTTGNYWIGVCVDVLGNESNTQNNCSDAIQITVANATSPDLVANSIIISPTSLRPNQGLNISARAVNRGTAPSGSSLLRYFISTNSTITRSDTALGTANIGALEPDKASRKSIDVSAPSATGNYWIGACVDSVANESNTGNNCSSGSLIEVTTNPATSSDDCTMYLIPAKNKRSIFICL